MKNFLSSPKNVGVFHHYAPLLQGGWRKILMVLGLIALCTFTMSKFMHVNMQGLNELMGKEMVDNISIVMGGLIGAFTITHFASMLPIVIRDFIYLFKKQKEKVNKPVLVINLIICLGILGFDGYISTEGIKNAVADIGQDLAAQKYQTNSSGAEQYYSTESGQIWQSWRTDSANIEKKYSSKISTLQTKAQGEINHLQGKAARGESAGSTTWAASLRTTAQNKQNSLAAKITEIETQKAQDLLDRSKLREEDLGKKDLAKEGKIGFYIQEKDRTEGRFNRYAGMTWILSFGLYLLYIGTSIKHELIHIEAGIENDVEVAERYFRPGFVQTLLHEAGDWLHDWGRMLTNFLAKKRQKMKENPTFRELVPLDGADVYKQEANFAAATITMHTTQEGREQTSVEEEPYKRGTKIGFGDSYLTENKLQTQPQTPRLPPPPPQIVEISAPCENGNKSNPIQFEISKTKVEISKPPLEISKEKPEISKQYLSYTKTGISKVEAQMRFRNKTGAVKPGTYRKNMENLSKAKDLLQQNMGQTSLELWV